jgi:hypothetical protein
MQTEGAYITEVIKLEEYVEHTQDPLMHIFRAHQCNTDSTLFQTANTFKKSLQSDTKQIKYTAAWDLKERWEVKRLHGQFPHSLDEGLIDKEQSYRWLKFGDIEGETESTIMAAQEQANSTNYFKKNILKQEIESRCQLCKEHEESIDHLTSGCPNPANNEYIIRHNKVCTHLHHSLCKRSGIETTEDWYSHIPKSVTEH